MTKIAEVLTKVVAEQKEAAKNLLAAIERMTYKLAPASGSALSGYEVPFEEPSSEKGTNSDANFEVPFETPSKNK